MSNHDRIWIFCVGIALSSQLHALACEGACSAAWEIGANFIFLVALVPWWKAMKS